MYVVIRCMLIHVMDVCYVAVDVNYVGMGCMLWMYVIQNTQLSKPFFPLCFFCTEDLRSMLPQQVFRIAEFPIPVQTY